jgi:molecular chaperone GrpE
MAIGDPFNAHVAEALTTMQRADLPDGSVAAIYEKAYQLRDQLIRPAKVVVNHRPEGAPEAPQGFETIKLDTPGESQ